MATGIVALIAMIVLVYKWCHRTIGGEAETSYTQIKKLLKSQKVDSESELTLVILE